MVFPTSSPHRVSILQPKISVLQVLLNFILSEPLQWLPQFSLFFVCLCPSISNSCLHPNFLKYITLDNL